MKIGDTIFVEDAWEDETGAYHDETATVEQISPDELLTLRFSEQRITNWCFGMEFRREDYEKEIIL